MDFIARYILADWTISRVALQYQILSFFFARNQAIRSTVIALKSITDLPGMVNDLR